MLAVLGRILNCTLLALHQRRDIGRPEVVALLHSLQKNGHTGVERIDSRISLHVSQFSQFALWCKSYAAEHEAREGPGNWALLEIAAAAAHNM